MQSGRSEKVTARDLVTASTLGRSIPDRSLRECTTEDLLSALRSAPADARKGVRIGLERLVQLRLDTECMGWREAERSLAALRAQR